jgi:hypothetical protein
MQDEQHAPARAAIRLRVARRLRLLGWIVFWVQAILAGFSAIILILFAAFRPQQQNVGVIQGMQFGVFFAIAGLMTLILGAYFAWRFTRVARLLQAETSSNRPSQSATLRVVRLGLIANLTGMLLTILGTQAMVGTTLLQSLAQPLGSFFYAPGQIVEAIDLLVVQANTNTITAHFVGIAAAIWLRDTILGLED